MHGHNSHIRLKKEVTRISKNSKEFVLGHICLRETRARLRALSVFTSLNNDQLASGFASVGLQADNRSVIRGSWLVAAHMVSAYAKNSL